MADNNTSNSYARAASVGDGIYFVRKLSQSGPTNWFFGLAGSTILKGSGCDIDIVAIPHDLTDYDIREVLDKLPEDFRCIKGPTELQEARRNKGLSDTKIVYRFYSELFCIDLIFPMEVDSCGR